MRALRHAPSLGVVVAAILAVPRAIGPAGPFLRFAARVAGYPVMRGRYPAGMHLDDPPGRDDPVDWLLGFHRAVHLLVVRHLKLRDLAFLSQRMRERRVTKVPIA
jgi:hypothetical protein